MKENYLKSKSRSVLQATQWRLANKDKHLKANREYKARNRARMNADKALYKATRLKATPHWLTDLQLCEISLYYIVGQLLNLQVDHIIPLKGKDVQGLHVPWNLQLLTKSENCRKGNRIT